VKLASTTAENKSFHGDGKSSSSSSSSSADNVVNYRACVTTAGSAAGVN